MADIRAKLAEPFPSKDIEWRAGATNQDKTKCLALAYLTARAVQDRLDDVFGIEGWRDRYVSGPSGGVLCKLSVRIGDEWITKEDVADNSDIEPVKGGVSDALKRAAVKFGVGRYLYHLEGQWVACEKRGNSVVIKGTPRLPDWALPESERGNRQPDRPQPLGNPEQLPDPYESGAMSGNVPKPNGDMDANTFFKAAKDLGFPPPAVAEFTGRELNTITPAERAGILEQIKEKANASV